MHLHLIVVTCGATNRLNAIIQKPHFDDSESRHVTPHVARLTAKRRDRASLQVHFTVSPLAHFVGVVTDAVAAVLPAAQTDALLEAIGAGTLEGVADVVLVHKGVHEEMHRPFVLALHDFNEICLVEKPWLRT